MSNPIYKVTKGTVVTPCQIQKGDFVRVKHLDEIEPKGYFWWYAQAVQIASTLYLLQLDFEYTDPEDVPNKVEDYTGYHIELLNNNTIAEHLNKQADFYLKEVTYTNNN